MDPLIAAAIINYIINDVINISLIIVSAFIIIEFDPPMSCFKTLSHIKYFRMSQNRKKWLDSKQLLINLSLCYIITNKEQSTFIYSIWHR